LRDGEEQGSVSGLFVLSKGCGHEQESVVCARDAADAADVTFDGVPLRRVSGEVVVSYLKAIAKKLDEAQRPKRNLACGLDCAATSCS